MIRHMSIRIIALCLALALGLAAAGVAEEDIRGLSVAAAGVAEERVREVDEIDIYDPSVYKGEAPSEEEAPEDGETPAEVTWQEDEPTGEDGSVQVPDGPKFNLSSSNPELRMGLGETIALGGKVSGFQSDDPDIARVDAATGVLTAVALGTTRVSALRKDGTTVSCAVTVLNAPDALSFEVGALALGVGEAFLLTAQMPEGTCSARITYASSDKSIVSVDKNGKLRANKTGSAVVAAKAFNGVQATCKVKVRKAPSKLAISEKKLVLGVGETATLTAQLPSKSASLIEWKSSDESVATVENGVVRAVGAGKATIRARTFNGKKADCKLCVLDGATPTAITLGVEALTLGVGEKYALTPTLGADEAAMFAYSSSDKRIATVSKAGVIVPKREGGAVITVATHNGLTAKVMVTVMKAPAEIGISETDLKLEVGKSVQLTAQLPVGCASEIIWESSDVSVATIDGEGYVTAVKQGSASVRARAYNGVTSPLCCVVVTEDGKISEDTPIPITPSAKRMGDRIRAYEELGGKRNAIANIIELLVSAGFKPAFAAGVGANILHEGTYGLFESSKYVVNYMKRPRYFCYLDGGNYYVNGRLSAVYMSPEEMETYTGEAETRERFDVENFYLDNYSRKYVYEINLDDLEAFMVRLDEGGWVGKFGVGIVQWTGHRTKNLLARYRKHAGAGKSTITPAQVAAAENEMILNDFQGDYQHVYNTWKEENPATLSSIAAARSAGSIICLKYEVPVDKETKAVRRGEKAVEIYKVMMDVK